MRTFTLLVLVVAILAPATQAQIPPKKTTAVAAASSENRLLVSTLAVDGIEAAAGVAVSDGSAASFCAAGGRQVPGADP